MVGRRYRSYHAAVYAGSHNCFVDGVYAALILAAARIGFDAENIRE